MAEDRGLGLGERSAGARVEQDVMGLQPVDAPEAGDQMVALHGHAVEPEVLEIGVDRGAGMVGDEAAFEV